EARLETEAPANAPASTAAVDASLDAARAGQDEVLAVLDRLLGRLNQWKDYRRFHQQWAELLRRQESLAERTESLGRDLLGKRPEDVSPETAARLVAAGNDQLELARQLDVLSQEMDESCVKLAERDPLAAKTVADAVARSRELGISSRMLAAGESIGRNRLGQAQASQAKIIDDFREVLALLAGRREDELARLAEKLPETEGLLSALIRRQTLLCERMEDEAAKPAQGDSALAEWRSLGRRQAQLQAEAMQLAALLTQLLAQQPAESVDEAAGHMRRASRSAESGRDKPAVESARRALASLEEAARRLDNHLRQVRADVAAEQLARLESAIRSIETRQRETYEATKRLDAEPRAADDGSRRATALRRLAGRQRSIETATSQLAATLAHAPVFHKVLNESAAQMAVAAGWLGRQASDARAQTAQEAALNGLTRLIASLQPSTADAPAPAPGGAQGAAENRPPGKQAAPGAVAQLRLLKMLQEDLFTRTQQWESRYGGQTPLSPEAEREYKRLSEEQGQVADLLFDLIENDAKDRTPPEDAPAVEAE
ncbi:MAG: hypothetical protein JW719_03590, partial [Pirellulales bacterium]|nr:hypothetical protein [Pirellulales bacterium]